MNTKTILNLAAALLPIIALAQTPVAPPAPPAPPGAPAPPIPPNPRDRQDRAPKVPVTYLGVETSEIPSVLCDQLGLPKGFGLVVDYVVPDGPAAAAGVQQNDVIKMFNDQILTDPSQLGKLVRSFQDGTTVSLTILRKGQEQKLTVKLVKKEVPRRRAEFRHLPGMDHKWNFDFGDLGMLKDQMRELKEQLGDGEQGMIHDAVIKAREEVRRAADEVRQNADRIRMTTRNNGALKRTTIDLGKAQIVFSDEKGELRVEKVDGKQVLTAKDPQGKLLFSGPVETKEDLDKVPAEVRQRYEQMQQRDLPAVVPDVLRADTDNNASDDLDNEDYDDDDGQEEDGTPEASSVSYEQVSLKSYDPLAWGIHAVLI